MTFVTGDLHGEFRRLEHFCQRMNLGPNDILIVLGESGINFGAPARNAACRMEVDMRVPCTLFCIHGNHDQRPPVEEGYRKSSFHGGAVMVHPDFPRQIFALDGEVFELPADGTLRSVFVMGGAHSVDRDLRLARGLPWYPDEQPSDAIKDHGRRTLGSLNWKVDIVLTHTCPRSVIPKEFLLPGLPKSAVNLSTESYLEDLRRSLTFRRWYCGHFHGEKRDGPFRFLYRSFEALSV